MSQTYYNHTSKLLVTKIGRKPACTIAISRKGNEFIYGITICSRYDNFCKKTGRKIAEERMNEGFGILAVPDVIKHLDEKKSCLAQLYNLTASVVTKTKKWKGRITRFNSNKMLKNKSENWRNEYDLHLDKQITINNQYNSITNTK